MPGFYQWKYKTNKTLSKFAGAKFDEDNGRSVLGSSLFNK